MRMYSGAIFNIAVGLLVAGAGLYGGDIEFLKRFDGTWLVVAGAVSVGIGGAQILLRRPRR